MKHLILFLALISFIDLHSQPYLTKSVDIYYDNDWNITRKEFGIYHRIAQLDIIRLVFQGEVKDYSMDSTLLVKGQYENKIKSGNWLFMYKNSQIKYDVNFKGENFKVKQAYDSDGIKLSKSSIRFSEIEQTILKKTERLDWNNSFNSGHEMLQYILGTQGYIASDVQPLPHGGMTEFYKLLVSNLNYPKKAIENKVSGKVYVQFVVTVEGNLEQFKVVKGIGFGCDEEALRIVKLSPNWIPGKISKFNEIIPSRVVVPVTFKF